MNTFLLVLVIALSGASSSSINVEETHRIVNGNPATYNQFPFMISLQRRNETHLPTRGHRCGGALISLRHALTAASCLIDRVAGTNTQIIPQEYRVFAGAVVLTNDSVADRIRGVERFILHPNYTSTTRANDIAVITLDSAFSNNVVQIVPLSTADSTAIHINSCTSSGWGGQTPSSVSTQLTYVQKTVSMQQACSAIYNTSAVANPFAILDSMICASSVQNYSSCTGDIGNPLVCRDSLNGILIQGGDCRPLPLNIEVYTRVSSFRPWIIDVTSGVSTFQPGLAVLAVIAVVQIITTKILN